MSKKGPVPISLSAEAADTIKYLIAWDKQTEQPIRVCWNAAIERVLIILFAAY